MTLTNFTPEQETAITITTCVLMVIIVIAFILWLFVIYKKSQELQNIKTKLEIEKLKQEINNYQYKQEFRKTEMELMKRKINKNVSNS